MPIKILLAEDHRIVREGLRALIEKQKDMEVVAEAKNGRSTVQLARKLVPDIVIMDITMPELNGIEATRQILAKAPGIKVIALSMHSDRRFVLEILSAGASGYLLKDCAFEELAQAIRIVTANQTYLSAKISKIVIKDYVRRLLLNNAPVSSILTAKEREILQLLAEGKATKEIASRLEISIKTVDTHRKSIMNKLDIHSIAELTKYAIRSGLTSLET